VQGVVPGSSRFLGSIDSLENAGVVLMGAPFDGTASFWPGTRFAPSRIRDVSGSLEEYSPLLDKSLLEAAFYDAGDVEIPLGDTTTALSRIEKVVRLEVLSRGKRPFFLGGEHLISLPIIRAAHQAYPDLAVLHFDAHADLRDSYLGAKHSHATVMRRVCEQVGPQNVYQFGVRSGSKEEFAYARQHVRFYPYEVVGPLRHVLSQLDERPVYVTLDIDVIDPGYAPATGTPEPCGCTPHELVQALHVLAATRVVGFDLVELCPLAESGVATSVLAAMLMREALLSFGS
jgi:agmatinase